MSAPNQQNFHANLMKVWLQITRRRQDHRRALQQ